MHYPGCAKPDLELAYSELILGQSPSVILKVFEKGDSDLLRAAPLSRCTTSLQTHAVSAGRGRPKYCWEKSLQSGFLFLWLLVCSVLALYLWGSSSSTGQEVSLSPSYGNEDLLIVNYFKVSEVNLGTSFVESG